MCLITKRCPRSPLELSEFWNNSDLKDFWLGIVGLALYYSNYYFIIAIILV